MNSSVVVPRNSYKPSGDEAEASDEEDEPSARSYSPATAAELLRLEDRLYHLVLHGQSFPTGRDLRNGSGYFDMECVYF